MQPLVLDFETFYTKDYSLRVLPTQLYVDDPRFETLGAGVKLGSDPIHFLDSPDIAAYFRQLDWDKIILVGHNLRFDGYVLNRRFGHRPAHYIDTLGLAKFAFPNEKRHDLGHIGSLLTGSAKKGSTAQFQGLSYEQIKALPELHQRLKEYCLQDIALTNEILNRLYRHLPSSERKLLSLTAKWAAEPKLRLDPQTLQEALNEETTKTEALITQSGVSKTVLSSNSKYAALLNSLGIKTPTKTSPTTGLEIPALGNNDWEYQIMVSQNPTHAHIFAGRKAAKSTIMSTRLSKFLQISNSAPNQQVCMPLTYCGAATTRWSGTDGLNIQNLPRGSKLRKSFLAPPGKLLCTPDLSQIELRMNFWFCNDPALEILRRNDDLYSITAAHFYGKSPADIQRKTERPLGKVLELSCGYGCGPAKFQITCALGPMGAAPIHLNSTEARQAVFSWRDLHSPITFVWAQLGALLPIMANSDPTGPVVHFGGPNNDAITVGPQWIKLPNSTFLRYPLLTQNEDLEWTFGPTGNKRRIYGAHLLENIIQALARVAFAQQILDLEEHPLIETVSCTHDEILMLFPETHQAECEDFITKTMSRSPAWAPELPMAVELKTGKRYSK